MRLRRPDAENLYAIIAQHLELPPDHLGLFVEEVNVLGHKRFKFDRLGIKGFFMNDWTPGGCPYVHLDDGAHRAQAINAAIRELLKDRIGRDKDPWDRKPRPA